MREVSFVDKLVFNFKGSVNRKTLIIGDVDNDGQAELVCANLRGEMAIFKGQNPSAYALASNLGMVTACAVGDVINCDRNFVAAINTEGWLFIFDVEHSVSRHYQSTDRAGQAAAATKSVPSPISDSSSDHLPHHSTHNDQPSPTAHREPIKLQALHLQRMPANCKELLLADLDGDGNNELIVGLTDRVLRAYKWFKFAPGRGKFVGLYKWEFADQIGNVSLNPSRHENCLDIIVAQPGGTFAKLECYDKRQSTTDQELSALVANDDRDEPTPANIVPLNDEATSPANKLVVDPSAEPGGGAPSADNSNNAFDNVRTEYISKLTPEYHQLALGQMQSHHVSTEVLGGIRDKRPAASNGSVPLATNDSLIVIATLDGTMMLVNDDEILWSLQVDHQLFALACIERAPLGRRVSRNARRLADLSTNGTQQTTATSSEPMIKSDSSCTIVPAVPPSIAALDAGAGNSSSSLSFNACSSSVGLCEDSHEGTRDELGDQTNSRPDNASPDDESQRDALGNFSLPDGQYFAVCAWDGKTYIVDEERNYLRFKFGEAVSAFTAGYYDFGGRGHTALVYATFDNKLILYYDVIPEQFAPSYLLTEVLKDSHLMAKLEELATRLESFLAAANHHSETELKGANESMGTQEGLQLLTQQQRQQTGQLIAPLSLVGQGQLADDHEPIAGDGTVGSAIDDISPETIMAPPQPPTTSAAKTAIRVRGLLRQVLYGTFGEPELCRLLGAATAAGAV